MPTITPQARPVPAADESAFRAPKKVLTASTGMDLSKNFSGVPVEQNIQKSTAEEIKPKEVTLSPQLTALARKEQAFRQKEQAFKAEQEKLAIERAEIAELKELKAKLASKDYSALEKLGIDYNEYSNYELNRLNGVDPNQQAIQELEKKVNSVEEQRKADINRQYEATVNQYKRDIKQAVDSNPEFTSVKEKGAYEHVLQHILDTFEQDGETLSVDQAAKEVEEAIIEEAKEWQKLSKLKSAEPVAQEKVLLPPKQVPKTLTNQVTQVTPSTPRNQFQHLTMKERIAQAAARSQKQQG